MGRGSTLRSILTNAQAARVGVGNPGTGLTAECRGRIVEPFLWSKPEGMGAHGGRLWAVDNAECGATFFFTVTAKGRSGAAAGAVREPAPGRGRLWPGAA